MPEKIYITFMRHGRSRADDEKVIEGRYDSPLTAIGQEQVRQRAQSFLQAGVHFDLIIASPLQRAQQTANIIAETLSVPLHVDAEWIELDNGPLAGMPFDKAEELYPKPDFVNPYERLAVTGECAWEAYRRASKAVENIIRRGPGNYLVVAHGGILYYAMKTLIGAPVPVNWQGVYFSFGDVGYLRSVYHPDAHKWGILELVSGLDR